MDKTVPKAAAHLLDYITEHESKGYDVYNSNVQRKLTKPLTKMTLAEVLAIDWRKIGARSSAAGRYQIIKGTLRELIAELGLKLTTLFDADMQDRLGYQLLRRRGYDAWQMQRIDHIEFGKRLAQEWASLPVLADTYRKMPDGKQKLIRRGAGWYDGDGLNAVGAKAKSFESALYFAYNLQSHVDVVPTPKPSIKDVVVPVTVAVGTGGAVVGGAKDAAESVTTWEPVISLASQISKYGPWVAGSIVIIIATVVIARRVWKG